MLLVSQHLLTLVVSPSMDVSEEAGGNPCGETDWYWCSGWGVLASMGEGAIMPLSENELF